jgi:hypothetical protein
MNKTEIIANIYKSHSFFWDTAGKLSNPQISIDGKWSVSQNVEHINIGLTRMGNYLALPKSNIESNYGFSERKSTNYETIFKVYRNAFENGVKASDDFVPKINLEIGIEKLVENGKKTLDVFMSNLKSWNEEELDLYNCPHPFLGKITVREILYFTIYHAQHHHETIKKME